MYFREQFFILIGTEPKEVDEDEYYDWEEEHRDNLKEKYFNDNAWVTLDFLGCFAYRPYEGKHFFVDYFSLDEQGWPQILIQQSFATYDEALPVYNKWASHECYAFPFYFN